MIFDESNVMIEKDSIFSQARLEGHTSVSQMQTWHIYYDSLSAEDTTHHNAIQTSMQLPATATISSVP